MLDKLCGSVNKGTVGDHGVGNPWGNPSNARDRFVLESSIDLETGCGRLGSQQKEAERDAMFECPLCALCHAVLTCLFSMCQYDLSDLTHEKTCLE